MRSELYEVTLKKEGVEFEYNPKLPMAEINMRAGLNNQARLLNPIDAELVETYFKALEEKSEFPAVVLWRPGKGMWIPIDGNQRLAAKSRKGFKFTDAYLLDTKDQQVADRITWTFNNKVNGKRNTLEECVQHAITFVKKYGYGPQNAAKEWGLPYWRLRDALQVLEVSEALDRQKVDKKPSEIILRRLNPLLNVGEDLVAKVATTLVSNGVTGDLAEDFIKDVKSASTQKKKDEVIEEFSNKEEVKIARAETKGGVIQRKNPSPRDRLHKLCKDINRLFDQFPDARALRHPAKDAREEAQITVNGLIALYGLGGKV